MIDLTDFKRRVHEPLEIAHAAAVAQRDRYLARAERLEGERQALEGRLQAATDALRVYLAALRNCLNALPAEDERGWDEDDWEVLTALRMQADLNIGCLDPGEDELAAAIVVLARAVLVGGTEPRNPGQGEP